ncbi:hypothetical protein N0V90_003448 [Kalmusia sp. IMI 367209]|nr:hypothetical protein N0V90_003448 [Kalmusia sp. IMI 367209]
MTEVPPNDLNFGHFGIPAYDLDNSEWAFVRTSHGTEIRQLGHWKRVIPAAVQYPSPCLPRSLRSARQATRSIVHDFPDLAPVTGFVPELEAVSAAATAALNTYDAAIGQLMSFGSISPGSHGHQTRQVVALPTGEGGNILRLQLLIKERYGWGKRNRASYLEGHSIEGECSFWNEDAAPIRQVCFAQSEDNNHFLAVRLPERIVLFHPAFSLRREAAKKSRFYNLPPSTVDLRPFHSVSIKDTGGIPHADVSYNPHYQRQFAIVDQDSNWSVWDIDGNKRGYSVNRVVARSMHIKDDFEFEEQEVLVSSWKEDGWARIMWVGDANTILVCNRRQLELVDLKGSVRPLKIPQVIDWRSIKNSSRHWILDVKRHPKNEKEFFVLTSVRLYLLAVPFLNDHSYANLHGFDAVIVLSWTHFRGVEDITLQLQVQTTSEEETAILIHSRLNTLITIYRVADQHSSYAPYCSFGPTTLRLGNRASSHESKLILNLSMERLVFKDWNSQDRGLGHGYIDRGVQFYQLSALFDDLSVAQTMLCSAGLNTSEPPIVDVLPVSWSTVIRRLPNAQGKESISSDDDDDFVQPDGLIHTSDPHLVSPYQLPKPLTWETNKFSRNIFDFTTLYHAVMPLTTSSNQDATTSLQTIDVLAVAEEVKRLLEGQPAHPPLGTLQEFAILRASVDDVDEVSAHLQKLFPTEGFASPSKLKKIASSHVLGFENDGNEVPSSLSFIYDLLLQNWIAPLPGRIPARIRHTKERMARRIAAELMLASTRLRKPEKHEALDVPSQDSAVALSSSAPDFQSQSSQLNDSNSPSASPAPDSRPVDPLSRLSEHLHINTSKVPVIPPSIKQVLSHWQLGADPSTYNWESTERALADELELDQDQEGTQKKREKLRRKKERQAKRQKRENEMFTGKMVESHKVESQPQFSRSSPGPFFAASSSQAPASSQNPSFGGLVVQSQAEPGIHGGRPVKKKKKVKSRISGF